MMRCERIAILRKRIATVLFLLFFFYLPAALRGQNSRVGGAISGSVMDSSGAAVTGATVTIRNSANGQIRSTTTDGNGRFQAWELSAGDYVLRVRAEGFALYENSAIAVSLGNTTSVGVQLSAPLIAQQVTVSAQPNTIDSTETAVTATIDKERIEELPVHSRNYLDFALLAPGVTGANQAASAGTVALPESGFSFGGLRPRSNAIYIDGVDNNDEFTGASRTELSIETVQEFQVVKQGLSAEAGGAAGGSVNVVTRSGANALHGDAFIFAESGALDASPPLEGTAGKPDMNRYRGGLTLSGPIRRDHTFYSISGEQEHARGQAASDIDAAAVAVLNPFLASGGVHGLSEITSGFFPITRVETELSTRVDHQINSSTWLSLRYSFTNNREVNEAFNTSELVDRSARGSSFTKDHSLVGGLTSLVSANRVNDFRFQLATRRLDLRTSNPSAPGMLIPGIVEFGTPYAGNNLHHENHSELSDTFSIAHGPHLFKAGITLNRIHLRANVTDGFHGQYIFRNVDDVIAGQPAYFQQAFGNPDTNCAVTRYAGFVQDHWTLIPGLTADIGLRYDFEHVPSILNQDVNNFSPRIGLAYSPAANWVIRSGFGIFFDRYPLAYLNQAVEKNGANAFDQVVTGTEATTFSPARPVDGALSGVAPSIYRPQSAMANAYSEVATFGIDHAVSANVSASATYSFVRGVKMPRTRNVNLAPPTVLSLQNATALGIPAPDAQQVSRLVFTGARLDPRYDGIYQLENEASSSYDGLTLTLNRRMANEFELLASYTISKAIDDASEFTESPQNPYDLKAERALSLNHQGQRFALSALFDLPIGREADKDHDLDQDHDEDEDRGGWLSRFLSNIEMAPIVAMDSGRPVNPLTGFDSNQSHTFPFAARPLGLARNSLMTPATVVFDLRVLKSFNIGEHGKFDVVAESFNLLNHRNVSQIGSWFGAGLSAVSTFGHAVETLNPRQLQFSLDFEF
jgi:hypothetical protein